jgi:hypothetical protein
MVGILKIQLGRLQVFSGFLLFEMSFEALFMWGLGCIEAEFLLNNFQCICEFFLFTLKEWARGGGLGQKIKNKKLKMQFVIKK